MTEHELQLEKQKAAKKPEFDAAQTHEIIKQVADAGMKLVVVGYDAHHLFFKLEGKINWKNWDGSTTVLEEQGATDTLENLVAQGHYYIDNADKYTDFYVEPEE